MAAGRCVVALDQCAERYIIKHNETGLLVGSPERYADAVRYLYENPTERERLGENARRSVGAEFTLGGTVRLWEGLYNNLLKTDKRILGFGCLSKDPKENFKMFLPPNLKEKSELYKYILNGAGKSSFGHFESYFPGIKERFG
jgi:hypothetical protein